MGRPGYKAVGTNHQADNTMRQRDAQILLLSKGIVYGTIEEVVQDEKTFKINFAVF